MRRSAFITGAASVAFLLFLGEGRYWEAGLMAFVFSAGLYLSIVLKGSDYDQRPSGETDGG